MGMDSAHARLLTGHTDERSFRRYVVAVEQEAAIAAYYRLKAEGQTEAVVYAKNLSREQRRLLIAMAELTQMQPMYGSCLRSWVWRFEKRVLMQWARGGNRYRDS